MKDGKYSVLLVEDQTIPTQLFEHFIQSSGRYELARSIESVLYDGRDRHRAYGRRDGGRCKRS